MSLFSVDTARLIPLSAQKISALRPDLAQMMDKIAGLDGISGEVGPPPGIKADNDPSQVYGVVKVGGQVVATLYNSGAAETSNALGSRFAAGFAKDTLVGPSLAADRAERLATALGGVVEKASTALGQSTWQSWKANRDSQLAAFYADKSTQIDAQSYASTSLDSAESVTDSSEATASNAFDDFRKFLNMTPEQRMRMQILASMGLTEEQVQAMPPEQQKKVEDEIKLRIKEQIRQATGIDATNGTAASSTASSSAASSSALLS